MNEQRTLVVEVSRDNEPFHVEAGLDDFDAIEVSNRPGEVQRVRAVDYGAGHVCRLKNVWHEYVYNAETRAMVRKEKEDGEEVGYEAGAQGAT